MHLVNAFNLYHIYKNRNVEQFTDLSTKKKKIYQINQMSHTFHKK